MTLVIKMQPQTKYLEVLCDAWDNPLTNNLSRIGLQSGQYINLKP